MSSTGKRYGASAYLNLFMAYAAPSGKGVVLPGIMNIILSVVGSCKQVTEPVDFEQFTKLLNISFIYKCPTNINLLVETFLLLDRDKDGCVSENDVGNSSIELNWNLTKSEIKKVHNKMDVSKSGCISFIDYSRVVTV